MWSGTRKKQKNSRVPLEVVDAFTQKCCTHALALQQFINWQEVNQQLFWSSVNFLSHFSNNKSNGSTFSNVIFLLFIFIWHYSNLSIFDKNKTFIDNTSSSDTMMDIFLFFLMFLWQDDLLINQENTCMINRLVCLFFSLHFYCLKTMSSLSETYFPDDSLKYFWSYTMIIASQSPKRHP